MALFRIMGRGETREESCFANNLTAEQAENWIQSKAEQYPETVFWVEREGNAYSGGEDEPEDEMA